MTQTISASEFFSGDQRTNIRMSKLARTIQTAAAKTNWNQMAKLLFRADQDQGRFQEVTRLRSIYRSSQKSGVASYGTDQFQYVLMLILVVSVAENRTQELYAQRFAQRCDDISKTHDLKDDQYWAEGNVPAAWEALNKEFEQESLRILLEVLREYRQDEIAEIVQSDGLEEFFSIIHGLRSQFLKVLEISLPEEGIMDQQGSFPEMVQPSVTHPRD